MMGKDIQRLQNLIDRLEKLVEEENNETNNIISNEIVNNTNVIANEVLD